MRSFSTCQLMPSVLGSGVDVRKTPTPPMVMWPRRSYWTPLTEPCIFSTTFDHGPLQAAGGVYVEVYGSKFLKPFRTISTEQCLVFGTATGGAGVRGSS